MNRSGKRLVFAAAIVALLVGVVAVDIFIYPLRSARPNFADVERVFNKIEIPADWVEIDSSENRGIAGRACPIEGSGCFSIGKRYKIHPSTPYESMAAVYETSGCSVASVNEDSQTEGIPPVRYLCSTEGLTVRGDYYRDSNEVTVYVVSY